MQRVVQRLKSVKAFSKSPHLGASLTANKVHGVVQRAEVTPTASGSAHATTVTLDLKSGDKPKAGSAPSVDPDGWTDLKGDGLNLTQTSSRTEDKIYVRFHVLNDNAGGPGDEKGNLTPTTKKANHSSTWSAFETTLKEKIKNDTAVSKDTKFEATVGYPSSKTVYWKKSIGSKELTTDDANYPSKVDAKLTVDGESDVTVSLDGDGDGLYPPTHFKTVPYWKKYSDSGHSTEDTSGTSWS